MKFDVNSLLQYLTALGYDCVMLTAHDGIWSLERVGRLCTEEDGDSEC